MTRIATKPAATPPPDPVVRAKVRDLLLRSEAFRKLPPQQQQQIAHDTVKIADYLALPEGKRGNELPAAQAADPYAIGLAEPAPRGRGNEPKEGEFRAQGAREGAAVAGALLREVNFPTFVASLIEGVFHAIVKSSIEQMEAYGRLVADVAKTLNQFRDEYVSPNQGRDHLVEQFPDLFQVELDTGADGAGPRVRLRDGADEDEALKRVKDLPFDGGPPSSLDDDTIEEKLVPAARTQLATSRQQLLATMVLMGINRIVVTDGKISAKVMYDFQARDNFRFQKSLTQMDYAKDAYGNLQKTHSGEGTYESEQDRGGYTYDRDKEGKTSIDYRGGSYYAKGEYKYAEQPVITMASASTTTTDASLTTKAQLAGMVEVNFKSDYLPLEKMADSFQIAQIQNAARPGKAQGATGGPPPAGGAAPPAGGTAGQQPGTTKPST